MFSPPVDDEMKLQRYGSGPGAFDTHSFGAKRAVQNVLVSGRPGIAFTLQELKGVASTRAAFFF